jgi:hypothetical protein
VSLAGNTNVLVCSECLRTRMRLVGHVTRMEDMRHEYKILDGKVEGKRPLGRLKILTYNVKVTNIKFHVDLHHEICNTDNINLKNNIQ